MIRLEKRAKVTEKLPVPISRIETPNMSAAATHKIEGLSVSNMEVISAAVKMEISENIFQTAESDTIAENHIEFKDSLNNVFKTDISCDNHCNISIVELIKNNELMS